MDDKAIRKVLVSYFKAQYSEGRIYTEKNIGGSICDMMLVSDHLTGIEIKSDVDNLQRLDGQVKCYDRVFEKNYVVVGEKYADTVSRRIPGHWGIFVVDEENIRALRRAKLNKMLEVEAQLALLWKVELKNLLVEFGLPMYAQKSKNFIAERLAEQVPEEELCKGIAKELLERDYSIFDAEDYTERIEPSPLMELLDSVSEMEDVSLDQWIALYHNVAEIRKKKDEVKIKERTPHTITYKDIEAVPGAPWVSKNIIWDFIEYLGEGSRYAKNFAVNYEPVTGNWFIEQKGYGNNVPSFINKYGIFDYNALYILEALKNLREIRRYHKNGKYDERSTLAAIEKSELIVKTFKEWVWLDEDRIWEIEEAYNKLFGKYQKKKYDGSSLKLEGMNEELTLFDYQKDAVQKIITEKNTLLAFDVGAGKTYIMIAAAMCMRSMGLSRKNMFVVPNNIVGQWEKIFTDMYPMARLLVIDPKSFKAPVRDKTLEKMKCGDYDGIIIAYSCFDMIPLSVGCINDLMESRLLNLNLAIEDLRYSYETGSRAALDKMRKDIMSKTADLIESMDYKSCSVTFDELEINTLFVDEAHNYKNIPIRTHLRNIRGINTKGSAKCSALLQKVRCVQEQNNGRGVVFATGTPLCNSLADAFTMQIYLQYDDMCSMHLDQFDNWVKTFAHPEQVAEIDVDTKNYRMVTRFSRFYNLPELSAMFSDIAIFYAMTDSSELPDFAGYTDCVIPKNAALTEYMHTLADRTELIRSKQVDKSYDNMLKISTDGRKAALDLRLVELPQPPETSKVLLCLENVYSLYNQYPGCSQLIFCDYSTPKPDEFNVYKEIKDGLISRGIPATEIAFIHSYQTEERKLELFAKVNGGQVRVLIGSTFKLGIGSNVQSVLKAVHHLDVPWRPADMVQREGRILRRGNTCDDVLIYRYICEGSFDAYSWQILETKQRFISQFLDGSAYQRASEDLESSVLSYAEVKALALSNEKMKLLAEKENELANYKILTLKHKDTVAKFRDDIVSLQHAASVLLDQINGVTDVLPILAAKTDEDYKSLRATLRPLLEAADLTITDTSLGTIWDFSLITAGLMNNNKKNIKLVHGGSVFYVELGDSLAGHTIRISNFLKNLNTHVEELRVEREKKLSRIADLEKEINRSDPYADLVKLLEKEVGSIRRSIEKSIEESESF